MELVLALAAGLLLGLLLGVLGGGGGIIAVPVLLALGESMDSASTSSLIIVGIGAATGLAMQARNGRIDWRVGCSFGLLGAAGAIAGSRLALWTDDRIQIGGFTILLLIAAWGMLKPRRVPDEASAAPEAIDIRAPRWGKVLLVASGVGLITGFFGVGGGFIAVPALVLALGMSMKRASATALLVILINAAIAFVAHGVGHLNVSLTLTVSATTVVGAVLGVLVQGRISTGNLQRAFGVLLVAAAAYEGFVLATSL